MLISAGAWAQSGYSIIMRPYPSAIIADGQSTTSITCEIYDNKGNAVADGIRVEFTTSLGSVTPYAETSGGTVQPTLYSVPNEGTAIVTATIPMLGVISRCQVDFLAPGTEIITENHVSVEGKKYLCYNADDSIIEAAYGEVTVKYKGINIECYECQIDTRKNSMILRPKIGELLTIKRQDKELTTSELYVTMSTNTAYGYVKDDAGKLVPSQVRLADLRCQTLERLPSSVSFDYEPNPEPQLYMTAKLLILEPKKEVKAKSPTLYVKGIRTFTVPYLKMSLAGSSNGLFDNFIAYGSNGLRIDLPVYVSLTPTTSTALRVQRDSSNLSGTLSSGDFWKIDLEHEYGQGTGSTGIVEAMNINQKDGWGLRFNNRTVMNGGRKLQSSIEYPNHENILSSVNYSQSLPSFYYSVAGRYRYYKNRRNSYYANTYVQTASRPVFGFMNYTLSDQIYYDASFLDNSHRWGNRATLNIFSRTLNLGKTQFHFGGSYSYNFQKHYGGDITTANAGLRIPFGDNSIGFYYSYLIEKALTTYESSYLSSDLNLWFKNLGLTANSTYNFKDSSYYVYSELEWYPIDYWVLRALFTYQHYTDVNWQDYKIAVGRRSGFQEFRIAWTHSKRRFDFEIGSMSF